MPQRFTALLLSVLLLFALFAFPVSAQDDGITYTVSTDGTLTISGNGAPSADALPTFSADPTIRKVVVCEGVTSLGVCSFIGCKNLTEVSLPSTLTELSSYVFAMCPNLTAVSLAEGITAIGEAAFAQCESLQSIVLPNSVTKMDGWVFTQCTALENVTLPGGLTKLPQYTFSYCSSLKTVDLPDSIEFIAEGAFWHCMALKEITLPRSLKTVDPYVFMECNDLRSVTMYPAVEYIGDRAFSSCIRLEDVYFHGTKAEFEAIDLTTRNEKLTHAELHFDEFNWLLLTAAVLGAVVLALTVLLIIRHRKNAKKPNKFLMLYEQRTAASDETPTAAPETE